MTSDVTRTIVELKTVQGPCIRAIIEGVKELVNEIDLNFDRRGLVLSNVDGTHMSMIHATVLASGIESYECREPRAVTACVAHLHKMLKGVGHRDVLTLRLQSDLPFHLVIVVENREKHTRSEARLKLLDTQAGELQLPARRHDVRVQISSVLFQKLCKDMLQITDTLEIVATRDPEAGLALAGEGLIGSLRHFLATDPEHGDNKTIGMTWTGHEVREVAQAFALKYLLMFTKATALTPAVTLTMTRDFPLLVTYPIVGFGDLTFCLVPKNPGAVIPTARTANS